MQTRGMDLRGLVVLLGVMFLLQISALAHAASDDYPNRPIQVIIGFTAGTSADLWARALVPKMGEVLGQPVVVVNKPGATGALGMTLVAKSKPDGYTIGILGGSGILFVPHMQKLDYDPLTDFTYICGTMAQPYGLCVRSDATWQKFEELFSYVKENPGKIKYGTYGVNSATYIYMESMARARGLNWVHVPFKGDAASITALLGGHVSAIGAASGFVPQVKTGKLRALAIFGESRVAAFPNVPTLKELGFKIDFRQNECLGWGGPKGIPPEILRKLENAFKQATETAEFHQLCEQMSNEVKWRDSEAYTKLVHELYPTIGEMIKQLGVRQE